VEDAAAILQVIAGRDDYDATSSAKPVDFSLPNEPSEKNLKIAVIKEMLEHPGISTEVKEQTEMVFDQLRQEGHEIEYIQFPYVDFLIPTYYVLTTAEASSNLARYDGMRYGYRSAEAHDMEEVYTQSRTKGFGPEVKRRIMLGTFVLSSGYYDAFYSKGQKTRRLLVEGVADIFDKYDFILNPTSPEVPFKFGEKSDNPVSMYLSDIFTVLANLTGCPAISLPMRKTSEGLPVGIHLMAARHEDAKLLIESARLMKGVEASVI
jgi:aspartyl-tRNA(Asn)/glutamyl-tRNA(Gln) amidotransferase subunit A